MIVLKMDSLVIPDNSGLSSSANQQLERFKEFAEEKGDLTNYLCVSSSVEELTDREALQEGFYKFSSENPLAEEIIDIMIYLVGYDIIVLTEKDIFTEI